MDVVRGTGLPARRQTAPRRRTRRLGAVAIALGAVVVPLVAAPAPASAGTGYTEATTTDLVTWVDSQDRQMMVVSNSFQTLQTVRDTPEGDPDLTWGQNGARNLVYDLPEGAAATSQLMAADDDGVITLVHTAAGCDATACDLWFQRVEGTTGDAVAAPVAVNGTLAPWRGLDDGSFLMRTPGDHLRWVGPDGTNRGDLVATTAEVSGADVDAAGRLLVLDDDGTLTRKPAGAAVDLTFATGCDQSQHPGVVGASPAAAGFAVACDASASGGISAKRYTDTGSLSWSDTSSGAGAPGGFATDATITGTGTVWLGTRILTTDPSEPTVGLISAVPATSSGWGTPVPLRVTGKPSYWSTGAHADYGGGVVQLRPVGSADEVAVADLRVCCQYPDHTTPNLSTFSSIVPYRTGPPTCATEPVTLQSPSANVLKVSFTPCPTTLRPERRPTAYRVDLLVGGVTTTKTVPDNGSATNATASFTGVANGVLAKATVTPYNADGDSTALPGPSWEATVFPFAGAADFVQHQSQHLAWQTLSASQVASYYYGVRSGNPTAATLMDQFLTNGDARRSVEPVSRIYRAAFLRDADTTGLRYWVARHRIGTRIATMAEHFARSSEFQRRYGTLTNRQFVQQIYLNVLGRPGDTAGIDFWTKRLDTRKATRGAVLANFSESGEFVRKTLGRAQVTTVVFLMLDRAPTATELTTWSGNPDVYGALPATVLATETYAARTRIR